MKTQVKKISVRKNLIETKNTKKKKKERNEGMQEAHLTLIYRAIKDKSFAITWHFSYSRGDLCIL